MLHCHHYRQGFGGRRGRAAGKSISWSFGDEGASTLDLNLEYFLWLGVRRKALTSNNVRRRKLGRDSATSLHETSVQLLASPLHTSPQAFEKSCPNKGRLLLTSSLNAAILTKMSCLIQIWLNGADDFVNALPCMRERQRVASAQTRLIMLQRQPEC